MKIRRRKHKKNANKGTISSIKNFYELLKISWSLQVKVFFETSTLHGVRYLTEPGRPFIEKFMWFCCICICFVATVVIILSLWEKFQTNPTITGLDTDFHSFDIPFPTVTICLEPLIWQEILPENLRLVNSTLQYLKAFSYKSLKELNKNELKEMRTDRLPLEIKTLVIPNCELIFVPDSCEFLSRKQDCCANFVPMLTEVGLCFGFNLKNDRHPKPYMIKDTDASWGLKFSITKPLSNANIPIYIHDFYEVPTIDSTPQHDWDYIVEQLSFSMKQTYTTNDTRQLSIKQRHCVFDDEVKLEVEDIYTFSGCTRQCRMKNSIRKCRCVPPFYLNIRGYRVCRSDEVQCIVDNLMEIMAVDNCDCQLRCFNTIYEVEKMKIGTQSNFTAKMEASFVSWPMVKYKREVLFGWVDLLVSFGGIAGLFLGCSLLSGVETVYFFTIRAVCMIFSERKRLEDIRRRRVLEPVPDYDLSLTPYFIKPPSPGNGTNEILKRFYPDMSNEYALKTLFIRVKPAGQGKKPKHPIENIKPPFGIEFLN
ncbi:pickpocket protein 11 isoform X2 [Agrilus planipennis]|uniref:Pickpocket protein 11 isoform X2 n=1 Tax=Agrilus planipennis TaxID=224129 RepID=A0A1W4XKA4_AGRPL|nr:pickpocket protein 11 isoform X2 [Agrilus planipennis]